MMKVSALVISSLGLVALASGCAVDTLESEELLSTEEQQAQVCSNDQATNAIIASMAVVMAREVGRWMPKVDLKMDASSNWYLALTQTAKDRCAARGYGQCTALQGLLNLQWSGSGMQFGGAQLTDPGVLQSRLYSYWDRQKLCSFDQNGDQGQAHQCPGEGHELTMYRETTSGSTCAGSKDFWYKAVYAAGHSKAGQPLSLADAAQLRNNLKWAGEAPGTGGNQYLQFELDSAVAGDVKIDPLDGSTGGTSGSTGVCEAAANPVWINNGWKCDNTNVSKTIGSCCSCQGEQRSWKAAFQTGFFVCKL